MKKLNKFTHGLNHKIKKIFFNGSKADKCHAYKNLNNVPGLNEKELEDWVTAEEYVTCYKITTRWQTL